MNIPRHAQAFADGQAELASVVENMTIKVFAQYGPAAFAMPRDAAIAHEAGHCIVGTHEGLTIRRVTIFSRADPKLGIVWGGLTLDDNGEWSSTPTTSAEADLRRSRIVITGVAAENVAGQGKPGSSLDEVALSRRLAVNAALKLATGTDVNRLWGERVVSVVWDIIRANLEPFAAIAGHLDRKEKLQGGKLRAILARVTRGERTDLARNLPAKGGR